MHHRWSRHASLHYFMQHSIIYMRASIYLRANAVYAHWCPALCLCASERCICMRTDSALMPLSDYTRESRSTIKTHQDTWHMTKVSVTLMRHHQEGEWRSWDTITTHDTRHERPKWVRLMRTCRYEQHGMLLAILIMTHYDIIMVAILIMSHYEYIS